MKFRELEKIRFIIKDATGLDIIYAYDDLVFPEHVAFMIQFDDLNRNSFFCYFHEDIDVNERTNILHSLTQSCSKNKCTLAIKGAFTLKQEEEEIKIHFL